MAQSHWLPDGVGTNGVFTEGPQIQYCLSYLALNAHVLPHCAIFCHMLLTFSHDNSSYCREVRHFCDDPVCSDPVWKLSTVVPCRPRGRPAPRPATRALGALVDKHTADLRTKILNFRGLDSSRVLLSRGGILMSMAISQKF